MIFLRQHLRGDADAGAIRRPASRARDSPLIDGLSIRPLRAARQRTQHVFASDANFER